MKYEKSCGVIAIKNNQVLLIKQQKGHISFPKGHVESGETEIETAIRETKEETGIDVKIINPDLTFKTSYSPSEGIMKEVIFYLAEVVDDTNALPQEIEVAEILWTDIDKVYDLITYDDMKNIFLEAKKYIA